MHLVGIDVVINEAGQHMVVDCNYLSNFKGLDENECILHLDKFIKSALSQDQRRSVAATGTFMKVAAVGAIVAAAAIYGYLKFKQRN